jgi:hypothetical protein
MPQNGQSATLTRSSLASLAQRSPALRPIASGFAAHAPFLGFTVLYGLMLVTFVLSRSDALKANFILVISSIVSVATLLSVMFVLLTRFAHMIRHERPDNPTLWLARDLARTLSNRRAWATGLPMAAAMLPFMYVYAVFKFNIPVLQPFAWDQTFDHWDRVLHLGTLPWQWLQPLLGTPIATFVIGFNYSLWFIALWGLTVWLAFCGRNDVLRTRYFITFMLTWSVGGSLLAVVWSSAGPVYWSRLGLGPDPYQGLMEYLRAANAVIPIFAIDIQDALWEGYSGKGALVGISAMPSLHNAMGLLMAVAAWRLNRALGAALWVHFALVVIGSVHLAWHYAVDAYIGIAMAYAFWLLSKPLALRWHATEASRTFDAALAEA